MVELERVVALEGVNLVELKTQFFGTRGGAELYTYENGLWGINRDTASDVRQIADDNDVKVQLHLPYTKTVDIGKEEGLCQGLREHHDAIIDRYKMIAELYDQYGICDVVTVHPPAYRVGGRTVCTKDEALKAGNELYRRVDELMPDFGFKLGVENMPNPGKDYANLGFEVKHLLALLDGTEHIGFTVDSGHRLLAGNMSVLYMFAKAPIVNLHFHSNLGESDSHELATERNLKHFKNYIDAIKRFNIPVVCEVSDLEHRSDEELVGHVMGLRERLN